MTTVPATIDAADAPVRKTITVKTSAERAFQVFTHGFDTWWPRSHSIGASPLKKAIIETKAGGRCYQESMDGSECDWGKVLVWEPPSRIVLTWQLNGRFEIDPNLHTEVEVNFIADGDHTRIELEHRYLERAGDTAQMMRNAIDSPGGWSDLLKSFADAAAS